MTKISLQDSINNAFISIDKACDYFPGASTATNLVDLVEKCILNNSKSETVARKNRYFSHIKDKHTLRCVTLLIPILGNIIIAIYDLIQNFIEEKKERALQDVQASFLGLDAKKLPKIMSKRRKIMKAARQEKIKEEIPKIIKNLDLVIVGYHNGIEKFKKIIENPDETVEVQILFMRGTFKGTHQEKIDFAWSNVRLNNAALGLANIMMDCEEIKQNEAISEKQKEISKLQTELLQLRKTSFQEYIKTLSKEDLLKEAKKYYLEKFEKEEREKIKESVEQMTLETIIPNLKEKILHREPQEETEVVEIQEIVAQSMRFFK